MQQVQQYTGQGQQVPPEPLRRRISSFLAHAVTRFRVLLLVVLLAAVAFLLGYFIYAQVTKKIAYDSATLLEAAEGVFQKWQSESDAAKKASLETDLLARLGILASRYPRQYGGQRALFLRADVSYQKREWDAALKDYQTLADRFPASYLAPISLFNAAICSEEKGDLDSAAKLYGRVSDTYKDSTVAPRALFDAGRIAEAKGAWADAQQKYESMDTLYSQSVWTSLAKNRLVALKAEGKIK